MNSLDLFTETIPELEILYEKPKIFWYVSAGEDFRGPVLLTQHHIEYLKIHHKKEFIQPELFIYNCLGVDVQNLKEKLSGGRVVLFEDNSTKIVGTNFKLAILNKNIVSKFIIDPTYINRDFLRYKKTFEQAFYFELEISGGGADKMQYMEKQRILYFEWENINFFENIILGNYFDTVYLCATREGCGYGGCKKSIIEYIYSDSGPLFSSDRGFKPIYNVISKNITEDLFKESINCSELISAKEYWDDYIWEPGRINAPGVLDGDSIVYKLDYMLSNEKK